MHCSMKEMNLIWERIWDDKLALENQTRLKKIQNVNNTLFCGSYFGYGFHEDGITSTIDMLKSIYD